jgi:NAD(P)-dependent dehydrogenase (short-subunit alcohol dehydrogenase family)
MPVAIVTGATSGIGRAAAIEMASRGVEVGIVGRDEARVGATARQARAGGDGAVVHEYVADLADLGEVRRLAAEVADAHPTIDVLANNAGAMFTSRHVTPDGFEETIALNHLAPFLLTTLLLPRISEVGGRVVTTSSDLHRGAHLDLSDLQSEHGRFRPQRAYGTSKQCNVLFTRELQRRHPDIAANCFHPGVIRTGFGKNDGVVARISLTLAGPFLKSPEVGARSLVWLALDPAAGDLRGRYVHKQRPTEPSAEAQDDRLAAELWERSEQLVADATG